MPAKYLYAIVDSSHDVALDMTGLDGISPVHTMTYRGVGCVLSDYAGREFTSMPKEEIVRCLLTHQVVVEHAMRRHTVLPAKFGTLLATSREVSDLLSQGHSQFVAALARMGDKVELEVAATWDTVQVLREVGTEPEIVQAKGALANRSGHHTLEERIHLGQLVKASLDRRRDIYRERMIDFLKPLAVDMQPNALVSDEMVLNVAFLVKKSRQEEFDSRLRQLNALFHDQINFRLIGPLPPYSFATVELDNTNPEKIEAARQLLHLGEALSEPEVRKAYRHLAAETHPDYRPGDELAKMRFLKLRPAAELLIAYCRGQTPSDGSLLINIRRLRDEEVLHLRLPETGWLAGATHG